MSTSPKPITFATWLQGTVNRTPDRIPLRDIPIAERLQQRLALAEERNTELHTAVTRAEQERDEAREAVDKMRDAMHRLGAEVVQTAAELDRLTVLLDQTRGALHVALHHADANVLAIRSVGTLAERARELDGCRIALQEATRAIEGATADPCPTSPTGDTTDAR